MSLRALMQSLTLALALSGATVALAQHDEAAGHGEELADHEAAHGEDGEAHEGGHEGAEAHGVELDPSRLAGQVINFVLWAGILWYLLKDRIPAFLASRRSGIVTELDEAKRMKDEAERKFAEYEERIENLDGELERMRAEMKKGGLAERDRIVAEASEKSAKLHAEAKFLVEQQMKQLREDLTREAIEAAIGAAEKILKERTQAADQERLANEYLERLGTQLKSLAKDGPSA